MIISAKRLTEINSKALQAYQVFIKLQDAIGEERKKLEIEYNAQRDIYCESFIEAIKAYLPNRQQATSQAKGIFDTATVVIAARYTGKEERAKAFAEEYPLILAQKVKRLMTNPALHALPAETGPFQTQPTPASSFTRTPIAISQKDFNALLEATLNLVDLKHFIQLCREFGLTKLGELKDKEFEDKHKIYKENYLRLNRNADPEKLVNEVYRSYSAHCDSPQFNSVEEIRPILLKEFSTELKKEFIINSPDYSFFLNILSHPVAKIAAAILVVSGLAILTAGTRALVE